MAARRKYWTRHAIFLYVTQRDKSCEKAFRYIPENDRLLVIKESKKKKKPDLKNVLRGLIPVPVEMNGWNEPATEA